MDSWLMMNDEQAKWLQDDAVHEKLSFEELIETLRDVCGREVRLSAPQPALVGSHLAVRGELSEDSQRDGESAAFTAGDGFLFLRADDFRGADRSSDDYGDYFTITVESSRGVFRVQNPY